MRRDQGLARVIASAFTGNLHPDFVPFFEQDAIYDIHELDAAGGLRLVASYTVDARGEMTWLPIQ